jgi:hypothetical protein
MLKIEGIVHGEPATMAGLGGGRGRGIDRQTKEPGAVRRPTSKRLYKTIEVCLTTKNRRFMADLGSQVDGP